MRRLYHPDYCHIPLTPSARLCRVRRSFAEWQETRVRLETNYRNLRQKHLGPGAQPLDCPKYPELADLFAVGGRRFLHRYRFTPEEFLKLYVQLDLPPSFRALDDGRALPFTSMEALALFLARLTFPGPLEDIETRTGIDSATLSKTHNAVLAHLHHAYGPMTTFNTAMVVERLALYQRAVEFKTGVESPTYAFVDRTCRSGLLFMAMVAPDGLAVGLYGPWPGRNNDKCLIRNTGIHEHLVRSGLCSTASVPAVLYAQGGFATTSTIVASPSLPQVTWRRMNEARVAVEHFLGRVGRVFAFCDFEANLKTGLQFVGKHYTVACFLFNCRMALRRRAIRGFGGLRAPALPDYLRPLTAFVFQTFVPDVNPLPGARVL